MRKTIHDIASAKSSNSPLVCLTAYSAPVARAADPYCDVLLVGDSVAMVLYGFNSTLQADLDMMIRHGRAVVSSTSNAMVVIDMPFGSYQAGKEDAFKNAAQIMKETGAAAVKCEGGAELADTIAYLCQRGIPVMGHIGLQPQSINTLGGFKAQGKDEESAAKIMNDARAVAEAGAFAIVVEGVAEALARNISSTVSCPTIGIGASVACDGQILVTEDMLGLTSDKKPKFVKQYASLAGSIDTAISTYAQEVRSRRFPDDTYSYGVKKTVENGPITVRIASEQNQNEERSVMQGILRAIPRRTGDR